MSIKMSNTLHCHRSKAVLLALLLAGFLLRMYRLTGQPLSWDEGWSIGLSSLPWAEINRITALDVHPPLYYYLFKLWLGLGKDEWLLRFLSVIFGVITISLAFAAARAWTRAAANDADKDLVGLLAAFVTMLSPFLLYYSQVARMFSLCAALGLLAAYCLLRAVDTGAMRFYGGFVLSAAAAIYSFYYTALILAALFLYVLLLRPNRWRDLLASAAAIALLYMPWLYVAVPPMLERVGNRTGFTVAGQAPWGLIADGLFGLVFAYGTGWMAVYVVLVLLSAAIAVAWMRRDSLRLLTLPALATALTILAVSVGARAHMFAARYLISASPFLALWIAWSIAVLSKRARWLGALALLLLVASTIPTIRAYVYEKPYEVSEAFDPQADYHFLQDKALRDDLVFYNVLSLAGHYQRFRSPDDAGWSYVLRWDPVIEPLQPALQARVLPAADQHRRLWFVLYKGTVGANFELKQWLDYNLFPAFGQWREDVLYLAYLPAAAPMVRQQADVVFDQRILLRAVEFTSRAEADGAVTVCLSWQAMEDIAQNYKVFVHLYTEDGRLVAQHDAVPLNELRPTCDWEPGEEIVDRHGLWVPPGVAEPLYLVVGLYDPEDGTRLTLPDGADHAQISVLELVPKESSG
jgi:hypothetical protein